MSANDVIDTYIKLHAGKIGQHWLWAAIERVVAGDAEAEVMRDFGYVSESLDTADRLEVLEREHAEFFNRWHEERRKRESMEQAVLQHRADVLYATQGAALSLADDALYKALKIGADGAGG